MSPETRANGPDAAGPAGRRLDSWKEIAAYLERDVRTVQRWETRDGLPVHRLHHRRLGSVFALTVELDAWRASRDCRHDGEAPSSFAAGCQAADARDGWFWPRSGCAWRAGHLSVAALVLAVFVLLVTAVGAPRDGGWRLPAVAPDAFESYLQARFHLNRLNRTRDDATESVRLFQESIARDATYAPAYAGLAAAYQSLGHTGTGVLPVVDTIPKVVAAARRALELEGQTGEALSTLAFAEQQAWHWPEAEAAYRRAIEIDSADARALQGLGALLVYQGRTKDGLELARAGRSLDPLPMRGTVQLAWLLYHARKYDESARELRSVLAVEPTHDAALWFLGFVLIEQSRFDEAIDTLEHAAGLSSRKASVLGVLARAYGRAGRRAEATAIINELEDRARAGYMPPAVFVHAYMGVGDHDRVFAALERAYREHSNVLGSLRSHPLYDPIRDDLRFEAFARRVGLGMHAAG